MSDEAKREYTLELEVDEQPITGKLSDDSGEALSFTGWLGLASALERLIDRPENQGGDTRVG